MTARAALGALALHATAVVWLTWPLAAHLTTHLPDTVFVCRFDALLVGSVLAHQSRALVSAPWTFTDVGIYHPAPHTLFYGEAGFGALPVFLPTFLASGNPTLALNVTFLAGLVLTAWALHWVVVRWTGSHAGGALAGFTFLASRWVHWTWIPAAPCYAMLAYLPVIVFLASDPAPSRRRLATLLALVVLQGLTSVYVAAATLAPLGLLALGRMVRPATWRAGLGLLLVLVAAAAMLFAVYAGYLVVRGENPDLATQTIWRARAFAGKMILPEHLVDPKVPTSVPPAVLLTILAGGLSVLLGGWRALDAGARRGWLHAALWTVAGVLIALTPVVRIGGTSYRLPQFYLGQWTPIYLIVREVHRLALAALVGLALLAGLAVAEGARRLGRHLPRAATATAAALAVAGLAAVMYGQVWRGEQLAAEGPRPARYPIRPAPDGGPPVLLDVLRRPGGPLLELSVPFTKVLFLDAAPNAESMYRAIFHRRRLVNGYNGYWPAAYGRRTALIEKLPDPDALRALRDETGLALVLVHDRSESKELEDRCHLFGSFHITTFECTDVTLQLAPWFRAVTGERSDLRLVARQGSDLLFAVGPAER